MYEYEIEVNMNTRFVVTVQAQSVETATNVALGKSMNLASNTIKALEGATPGDIQLHVYCEDMKVGSAFRDGEQVDLDQEEFKDQLFSNHSE